MANAVTRSGSNAFHGLAFTYLNNDVLNAPTFQQNAFGLARTPLKQIEAGGWFGGAILKDRLFFSTGLDRYRSRALGEPEDFQVPLLDRFRACALLPGVLSRTADLLGRFPPPAAYSVPAMPAGASPCSSEYLIGTAKIARPISMDRGTALERLDYRSAGGTHRLTARLTGSRLDQPDQEFSPYAAFRGEMTRTSTGVAVTHTASLSDRPSMM